MAFDYFYIEEADQFAFYRIPKVLFTEVIFSGVSTDAKVLYGLLLDRVSLSRESGWVDDKNRIYIIFTIAQIEEAMNISDKSATKYLEELVKVGLIERVKHGQGKPDTIYVKNFKVPEMLRFKNRKSYDSEGEDIPIQEAKDLRPINTDINKTKDNKTDSILSEDEDGMSDFFRYYRYFYEKLEIESLKEQYPYETEIIDGLLELIIDCVCTNRKTIRIAGDDKPAAVVKSRLMKLTSSHIGYVILCLQKNTSKVNNIKQYMLASLYNAPVTKDSYYRSWVNNDLYGGGANADD